jgi:hypothetical protein
MGCPTQSRNRCLELALDRSFTGLALPAAKARAIVVQHELHGTRHHCVKLSANGGIGKERNPLKMIDFRSPARQCATTAAAPSPIPFKRIHGA